MKKLGRDGDRRVVWRGMKRKGRFCIEGRERETQSGTRKLAGKGEEEDKEKKR